MHPNIMWIARFFTSLSIAILLAVTPAVAGTGTAKTMPAIVFRTCGPGDFWSRTVIQATSSDGEVAEVEFEEGFTVTPDGELILPKGETIKMKSLHKGHFVFKKGDDHDDRNISLAFKNGRALFPCARDANCKAADGALQITKLESGKSISGKLTWTPTRGDQKPITVPFIADKWLTETPECL